MVDVFEARKGREQDQIIQNCQDGGIDEACTYTHYIEPCFIHTPEQWVGGQCVRVILVATQLTCEGFL